MSLFVLFSFLLLVISLLLLQKSKFKFFGFVIIYGIIFFSGIVHNSNAIGMNYVQPAALASYFHSSHYARIAVISVLSLIILLELSELMKVKQPVLISLFIMPFLFALYQVGSGDEGFNKGMIGFYIRTIDILGLFSLTYLLSISLGGKKLLKIIKYIAMVYIAFCLVGLIVDNQSSFRAERFRGISFSSNWAGAYLAMFSIYLLAAYSVETDKKNKILSISLFFVSVTLLLLTGSRGAMLSAAIGVIIFHIYNRKLSSNENKITVLIFYIVPFLLLFYYLAMELELFSVVSDRLTNAGNTRADIWEKGYNNWVSNNVFFGTTNAGDAVESLYLSVLYVYGIIGFTALILVIAYLLASSYRHMKYANSSPAIAGFSVFVCFLINNLFEALYLGVMSSFHLFMYFSLGLIFAESHNRLNNR